MDPTLAELLADEIDLSTLSDEALEERRLALSAAIRAANEGERTAEILSLAAAGKDQALAIIAEQKDRAEAAAALVAEMNEIVAALDEAEAEPEVEETAAAAEEGAGETEGEGEGGATETAPAEAAPEGEKEVSAAAAPKRPPMKRDIRVPARQQPRAPIATAEARPSMIATGEVRGVAAGHHFADMNEVNKAMFDRWLALRQTPRDGHPHLMTTIDYQGLYGPEQTLDGGDPWQVSEKVQRYLTARAAGGDAMNELRVASGGVPGPAEPRYGQITFGQADRPVRDALPKFLASRGEIVFNGSPTLADVLLDTAAGAIGTVTSAQDAATATKNVQEISAPTATTVVVEAETMRWAQGNFADRFYPERTQAFMKLGQVAYARHNEALRLTDIKSNSTLYTDTPAKYGAYRDLKAQFLGQAEGLEDLVRDFELPLMVIMPEFVPAMLAADMIRQQPGDRSFQETEASMRSDIQGWDPDITIVWAKDSIRGRLSVAPSGQSPRSYGFDADVEWAMFPDGAFLFLDGGQLDLGILRDTTVSATNKFQTFFESWEALAPLLSKTLCFWMTSSLCSDGASQIATNIAICSVQNS